MLVHYDIILFYNECVDSAYVQSTLDSMSEDGWELISAIYSDESGFSSLFSKNRGDSDSPFM